MFRLHRWGIPSRRLEAWGGVKPHADLAPEQLLNIDGALIWRGAGGLADMRGASALSPEGGDPLPAFKDTSEAGPALAPNNILEGRQAGGSLTQNLICRSRAKRQSAGGLFTGARSSALPVTGSARPVLSW